MKQASSVLFLLSAAYPYGSGEVFLENELPYLLEVFDRVVIFPMFADGPARTIPNAPHLEIVPPADTETPRRKEFWRGIQQSGRHFFSEWRRSPGFPFSISGLYRTARTLGIARRVEQNITSYVHDHQLAQGQHRLLIYSYWMMQSCLGGIFAAHHLNIPVVSRVHGGDLYTERYHGNYLPWQAWKLQHLDYILPVSEAGASYLKKRYPEREKQLEQQIRLSRLGVQQRGRLTHAPGDPTRKNFHVVSCSTVYGLKRVPLIYDVIKALSKLLPDQRIYWTHIGEGPDFKALQARITADYGSPQRQESYWQFGKSSQNLEIRLCGNVPNTRIIPYYIEEKADLFINYSTSEGIPVSIMEAFSAGMPAAAPDIGGMRELFCDGIEPPRQADPEKTPDCPAGLLFHPESPPEKVARSISKMFYDGAWPDKGVAARRRWAQEFDAAANYIRFARWLREIAARPRD